MWNAFQETHRKIENADDENENAEKYLDGELYSIVSQLRQDYKIILEESLSEENSNQSQSVEVNLPQISVPKFGGEYNEWMSFKDIFTTLIHNNKRLANVQKLHYLKASLHGEAEILLKQFTVTDSNYEPAWTLLQNRYSNNRILIKTQLNILLSQPSYKNDSATNIRKLLDTTTECIQSLKNLKLNVDGWNEILVYLVSERLPVESKKIWEQEIGADREFPKYKKLQVFLESRFRVLESLENCEIGNQTFQQEKNFISTIPKSCKICNNMHQIFNCPEYFKLDIKARRDLILQNKLCFNCLRAGHTALQCYNQSSCYECNQRHHTSLHLESSISHTCNNEENNIYNTNQITNRNIPGASSQNFHTKRALDAHEVLLATARVKVKALNGSQTNIRVLIDPASQSTFISERVIQLIKAKTQPTSTKITGLQDVKTGFSTKIASVQIESLTNQSKINVEAFVLEKLTGILPGRVVKRNKMWSHLSGLVLADPDYNQPQTIDMIIGADKSAEILLNGIRKRGKREPMAQNTVFGWVIFGQTAEYKGKTHISSSFYTNSKHIQSHTNKNNNFKQQGSTNHFNKSDRLVYYSNSWGNIAKI